MCTVGSHLQYVWSIHKTEYIFLPTMRVKTSRQTQYLSRIVLSQATPQARDNLECTNSPVSVVRQEDAWSPGGPVSRSVRQLQQNRQAGPRVVLSVDADLEEGTWKCTMATGPTGRRF